jgi:hypothetical protein
MTRRMNRPDDGAFRVNCRRSPRVFRRIRVSFVRPRTVGFYGECPPLDRLQERAVEVCGERLALDKAVRVKIVHARPPVSIA